MPKRKRSQFEPIPVFDPYSERSRRGYEGNAAELKASLDFYPSGSNYRRAARVIDRTHRIFEGAFQVAPPGGLYQEALVHERRMRMMRRFGLATLDDAAYFFEHSGRGSYVVKKWREVLDRRRREAYVRLRSWLPIELAQRILRMNASFATYAVSDGRWRRAEQLD